MSAFGGNAGLGSLMALLVGMVILLGLLRRGFSRGHLLRRGSVSNLTGPNAATLFALVGACQLVLDLATRAGHTVIPPRTVAVAAVALLVLSVIGVLLRTAQALLTLAGILAGFVDSWLDHGAACALVLLVIVALAIWLLGLLQILGARPR